MHKLNNKSLPSATIVQTTVTPKKEKKEKGKKYNRKRNVDTNSTNAVSTYFWIYCASDMYEI